MHATKFFATIVLALAVTTYAAPLPRPVAGPAVSEVTPRAGNDDYIKSLQQLIADHQNRWQDYTTRINRVLENAPGDLSHREQAIVDRLSAQAAKTQEAIDRMTQQISELRVGAVAEEFGKIHLR